VKPTLVATRLSKHYPGVHALDNVSLEVNTGEVVGLIGQNGAGKSTLLRLLAGAERPDSGSIELRGRTVKFASSTDATRQGIGVVHQDQSLVLNLSVAENVFLGRESDAIHFGFYDWRRLRREAQQQLAKTGAEIDPSLPVESLSFLERQAVELAKVLALEDRVSEDLVVMFDEPTSVLSGAEIERLFALINRLSQRAAIIFVSHRMEEVLSISDRVYVLADGKCVAHRSRGTVDDDELYRLMVGEHRAGDYYSHAARGAGPLMGANAQPRLEVSHLSRRRKFEDVSLTAAAGEIVGIAGVVGSGREAVSRALFGAERYDSGEVKIDGKTVAVRSPTRAVRLGIGFIPADRKGEGMIAGRSVAENILLAATPTLASRGLVRRRREKALVQRYIGELSVKTSSSRASIENLSGGNQQKVVMAKWLAHPHLRVLILDHPTRGLDLRAKADVYRLIRTTANAGVAILLLSDTLDELVGLSDSIVAMRDGVVTARFTYVASRPPSSEEIVRAMV